ncbi:MAG: transposase [Candidatus Nitrosopolaris sp.]
MERIKPIKPNTIETTIFDKKLKVSRRVRRLVNNFPYYTLGQYIKYKAAWLGIRVVEISEAYTSQTCCKCGTRSKKSRKSQGLYKCKSNNCNEINADYNAAMNLLQRGVGILSTLGGLRSSFKRCFVSAKSETELAYPKAEADKLPMIVDRNKVIRVEPPGALALGGCQPLSSYIIKNFREAEEKKKANLKQWHLINKELIDLSRSKESDSE